MDNTINLQGITTVNGTGKFKIDRCRDGVMLSTFDTRSLPDEIQEEIRHNPDKKLLYEIFGNETRLDLTFTEARQIAAELNRQSDLYDQDGGDLRVHLANNSK